MLKRLTGLSLSLVLLSALFLPIGTPAVQAKTLRPSPRVTVASQLPAGTEKSSNWAGYALTRSASGYDTVKASWTVPLASGFNRSIGAQWVGLGGYSSSDLLQLGTIEQISGGREVVDLFWEQLPANAQDVGTVPAGSQITASVAGSGQKWQLTFNVVQPNRKKVVKKITASVSASYVKSMGTSAEWISEDPSDGNGNLLPLANTGVVHYSGATANNGALTARGNVIHPLAVAGAKNQLRLIPSNLTAKGTAFSTENAPSPVISNTRFKLSKRHQFRVSHLR